MKKEAEPLNKLDLDYIVRLLKIGNLNGVLPLVGMKPGFNWNDSKIQEALKKGINYCETQKNQAVADTLKSKLSKPEKANSIRLMLNT